MKISPSVMKSGRKPHVEVGENLISCQTSNVEVGIVGENTPIKDDVRVITEATSHVAATVISSRGEPYSSAGESPDKRRREFRRK